MKNIKKDIKSFIREEDGKTIKKSLLISSLGLILGFGSGVNSAEAGRGWKFTHNSGTTSNAHSSGGHNSHTSHSSY